MTDFIDFALSRYSVRKYSPKPVEDEKIRKILEAAKIAPTAKNNQPQKIYVVKSKAARDRLTKVTPCTFDAPVVFVIGYYNDRTTPGKLFEGYQFGDTDAAIVCSHMMLEAHDLGLGSCWVGWFVEKEVKDALNIPDNISVRSLLPVGYAAPDSVPSERHLEYRDQETYIEEL